VKDEKVSCLADDVARCFFPCEQFWLVVMQYCVVCLLNPGAVDRTTESSSKA
jgi:hypothetical protein